MATRFYLPSAGTSPLPGYTIDTTGWERSEGLERFPMYTTKQNTALTTKTTTWAVTSSSDWCWYQYVSPSLSAGFSFTTSHTMSIVVGKCGETTINGNTVLNHVLRIVSSDGSTVRGTAFNASNSAPTEFPLIGTAPATRTWTKALDANVTAQVGDRLVYELGVWGTTPALENIQMRIGDPSGTADFALTEGLTTDLCPWMEISGNLSFSVPISVSSTGMSSVAGCGGSPVICPSGR